MEEKNIAKISLSTFFLIIAIVVIIVMGYFMFKIYSQKTTSEKYVSELNTKISSLEEAVQNVVKDTTETSTKDPIKTTLAQQQETNKTYSYKDVKGLYKFNQEISGLEIGYNLCLYNNGTYEYTFGLEVQSSLLGNYIIENDTIILNKMFRGGNDVGLRTTSGEIKLKINSDGSIVDTNNLISENIKYAGIKADFSNINLKKVSLVEEQEYLNYFPSIMTHINNSISNNAVTNGE